MYIDWLYIKIIIITYKLPIILNTPTTYCIYKDFGHLNKDAIGSLKYIGIYILNICGYLFFKLKQN